MPINNDFRTKSNDQLTYYVVDNLRANGKDTLFRYDTVEEAMEKFKTFPKDQMSALGISIHGSSEVDLVHRVNGEPVKVMDYSRMNTFSDRTDVKEAISQLEEGLSISYQYVSGIHPRRSVLASLQSSESLDAYLNNKVLFLSPKSYSQSLFSTMNEIYVEGQGWMEPRDFLRAFPDTAYDNPVTPVVRRINATYKEIDTGYLGQCDMSPVEFEQMMKKTKEYAHSFADKVPAVERKAGTEVKESIDSQILDAKREKALAGEKKADRPLEKER